jgi:hypothetical protein
MLLRRDRTQHVLLPGVLAASHHLRVDKDEQDGSQNNKYDRVSGSEHGHRQREKSTHRIANPNLGRVVVPGPSA